MYLSNFPLVQHQVFELLAVSCLMTALLLKTSYLASFGIFTFY